MPVPTNVFGDTVSHGDPLRAVHEASAGLTVTATLPEPAFEDTEAAVGEKEKVGVFPT